MTGPDTNSCEVLRPAYCPFHRDAPRVRVISSVKSSEMHDQHRRKRREPHELRSSSRMNQARATSIPCVDQGATWTPSAAPLASHGSATFACFMWTDTAVPGAVPLRYDALELPLGSPHPDSTPTRRATNIYQVHGVSPSARCCQYGVRPLARIFACTVD